MAGPAGGREILIVHPDLRPPGGGNAVASWAIQALAARHRVTVLSWHPTALDEVNRFYGTSLTEGDFRWVQPPRALRVVRDALTRVPSPLTLLKGQLLARHAKQLAPDYDLLFSTENEMDLGGRGVQYVHYPWLRRRADPDVGLDLYYRLAFAVSGYDEAAMRGNLTLVNSDWTGRRVGEVHDIPTVTLYPPVAGRFEPGRTSWRERQHGFVVLGRFAAEKRLDLILDVVTGVRARGHDVHLHLVGSRTPGRYCDKLLRRARALAWVTIHEDLARDDLLELLATHRYGLHGMAEEHFGIAVAEMLRAGCIPFVPARGGQMEIVDHAALLYRDREEAIERIDGVLGNPALQDEVRAHLAAREGRFSARRFETELTALIDDVMSRPGRPASARRSLRARLRAAPRASRARWPAPRGRTAGWRSAPRRPRA